MHLHFMATFLLLSFVCVQFTYKQEAKYSIGTLGFVDVDCDFIDLTYVSSPASLIAVSLYSFKINKIRIPIL